ncbi:MAG: hypothetical protein ABI629_02760 [bacterium]
MSAVMLLAWWGAPAAASAKCAAPVEWIAAHWDASTDAFAPSSGLGAYQFTGLAGSNAGDLWIAGDHLMLRIHDGQPSLAFAGDCWPTNYNVAVDPSGIAWLTGVTIDAPRDTLNFDALRSEAAVARLDDAQIVSLALPAPPPASWAVPAAAFTTADTGWAVLNADARQPQVASRLLRFDHGAWRDQDVPVADPQRIFLRQLCAEPFGDTWFVGTAGAARGLPESASYRAVVLRQHDDAWSREEPWPDGAARGELSHVVCLGGGAVVAGGSVSRAGGAPPRNSIVVRAPDWQVIALPDAYAAHDLDAVAAVTAGDVWVSVSSLGDPAGRSHFLHWSAGSWSDVPGPSLPSSASTRYAVRAMQFLPSGEGWAVADHRDRPARGLLLHYADGAWRLQNWNWHFWDEPWLGLFGH